ncbi:ATP synthase F1 subunit delta [bacterium]|nr:ATP synthase F1 subunit delta [bacterium]
MNKIISSVSKNYAKALLDFTNESGSCAEILNELDRVLEVINSSQDLKIVMANSSISVSKKIEIIETIFRGKINSYLLNFLKILVEKGRFEELTSIRDSFSEMFDTQKNKKTVEVISPITLNFENKSNILFKLEHKLNSEISPIWTVDEDIIAGLVIKFDDYIIDTSIRAKLEDLSKNIKR